MNKPKNDLDICRFMREYLRDNDSKLHIEIRNGCATLIPNAIFDNENIENIKRHIDNELISVMYKISKEL